MKKEKEFRQALEEIYDIPEPSRKEEFFRGLPDLSEKPPRVKKTFHIGKIPVTLRCLAAALTALVCIGTYSICNVIPDVRENTIIDNVNESITDPPSDTTDKVIPSENKPETQLPSEGNTLSSGTSVKTTVLNTNTPDNITYPETAATTHVKNPAVISTAADTSVNPPLTTTSRKNTNNIIHTTIPPEIDSSYGSTVNTDRTDNIKTTAATSYGSPTATSAEHETDDAPNEEPPSGGELSETTRPAANAPSFEPTTTTVIFPSPNKPTDTATSMNDGAATMPVNTSSATRKTSTTIQHNYVASTTTKTYETETTTSICNEYETTTTTTTTTTSAEKPEPETTYTTIIPYYDHKLKNFPSSIALRLHKSASG